MNQSCFNCSLAIACALAMTVADVPAFAEAPPTVTIDNFTFKPAKISVKVGTTVTFTNRDDIPHSVVASDGSFRSRALDTGDNYSFTFQKAGDFGYFCGLHPHMQGDVVVTP